MNLYWVQGTKSTLMRRMTIFIKVFFIIIVFIFVVIITHGSAKFIPPNVRAKVLDKTKLVNFTCLNSEIVNAPDEQKILVKLPASDILIDVDIIYVQSNN